MLKSNGDDLRTKNVDNGHNRIFSVSKLNLIKKIYKKTNVGKNNNNQDCFYEDISRDKFKMEDKNIKNLKKKSTSEFIEKNISQNKIAIKQKFLAKAKEEVDYVEDDPYLPIKENKIYDFLTNDTYLKNLKSLIIGKITHNKEGEYNNGCRRKNEFNSIDDKIELETSFEARLFDEKKVKRLEEWDKHKLNTHYKNKNSLINNKDLDTLNWMNEIKDSLSRIDKKNMSNLLNDFYKKNEMEQGTILMSNINLGKKTFNFEIFDSNNRPNCKLDSSNNSVYYNENTKNNKHVACKLNGISLKENRMNNNHSNIENNKAKGRPKTQSYLNPSGKKFDDQNSLFSSKLHPKSGKSIKHLSSNEKNISDFIKTKKIIDEFNKKKEEDFFRSNDIKVEGDLEALVNKDLYRKIIKEKKELENTYRKELFHVAQLIQKKKVKKENLNKECRNYADNLQKIRNEYRDKKDMVETHKKELDKLLGAKMNFLNQNNSIESSQLSKDPLKLRKEERLQQIIDYQKLIQQKDFELNNLNKEYENAKHKYLNSIQEKKVVMKSIEEELKELKINMNNLLDDQRKYFIEILKKGIDSRREGLCWVVKKLIELNTLMEYSMFPRFLDHSQIDYLLHISYKQIECYQLKLIFKALKKSQKKLNKNRDVVDSFSNTCRNFFSPNSRLNQVRFDANPKNIKPRGSYFFQISFSEKLISVFESIIRNNLRLTKNSDQSKLNDIEIINMVNDLKKKLLNYNEVDHEKERNEFDIDAERETILNYFEQNAEQKEYFEEILIIKDKILYMENEITQMIEDYKSNFKKRNIVSKNGNAKTIQYDLIYSALFGNGIII